MSRAFIRVCGSFVGRWQSQGGLAWEIEHHAKESFPTLVRIPCLEFHVVPWKGNPGEPLAKGNRFTNDALGTKGTTFSYENILHLQISKI